MSKRVYHKVTLAVIVFLVITCMLSILTHSTLLKDKITTKIKPSPHPLQYRSLKMEESVSIEIQNPTTFIRPNTLALEETPIPTKHFLTAVLLVRIYQSDHARLTLAHILQWLKYMRYAGVSKFYVYDAYESPTESLQYDLQHYPYIAYHSWNHKVPFDLDKTQVAAYQHAIDHYKHECEWQIAFDMDEYPLSPSDSDKDFLARYLHSQKIPAHAAEITFDNYLQVGPANFDERLWLTERYPRLTIEPGTNLVKPVFKPVHCMAGMHHNTILTPGMQSVQADARYLFMAHVWGGRLSNFQPTISENLLDKTKNSTLLSDMAHKVKAWQGDA